MSRRRQYIAVWGIRQLQSDGKYQLRWRVGDKVHSRVFPLKRFAVTFRDALIAALGALEPFDPGTGLPSSLQPATDSEATSGPTLAEYALTWLVREWPEYAPRSRRSLTEVHSRLLLIASGIDASDAQNVRAVATWLCDSAKNRQRIEPENPVVIEMLASSPPLAEINLPLALEFERKLLLRGDGKARAPSSLVRYRNTARQLLNAAQVEHGLDDYQWPQASSKTRRRKNKGVSTVKQTLPSCAQVEHALTTADSSRGSARQYLILSRLALYAGLRPSEAISLRVEDLILPKDAWGSIHLVRAFGSAGSLYTEEGEVEGTTKTAVERGIPIPPILVQHLRNHLDGRTSGLIAQTANFGNIDIANWRRWWRKHVCLSSMRIYDLRHVNASMLLKARVNPPEVARRLGHSTEVLMSIYAHHFQDDVQTGNDLYGQLLAAELQTLE